MEVDMQALKENVITMIKNMPQDVSVEDIMAELYFRYEVDQGIKQLDEGKGIPHKEIEKRMKKWLKK
jgi:predicted transcriptional regulator